MTLTFKYDILYVEHQLLHNYGNSDNVKQFNTKKCLSNFKKNCPSNLIFMAVQSRFYNLLLYFSLPYAHVNCLENIGYKNSSHSRQ